MAHVVQTRSPDGPTLIWPSLGPSWGQSRRPSRPEVIENSAKPKAANAGRVIAPEEVLAISDEGTSDYYFKWPHALAAGPDGGLLLTDVDQVLWFGGDGRFLGNLFKKGQGPGEMPWTGTARRGGKGRCRLLRVPGQAGLFRRRGTVRKGDRRPGRRDGAG